MLLTKFLLASAVALVALSGNAAPRQSIKCSPSVLRTGDVLSVEFSMPHGGELGVWAPGRNWLYIAFAPEPGRRQPPIAATDFAKMQNLSLRVGEFVAIESTSTERERQIFVEPGSYRFIVGANLETESNDNAVCDVQFIR